MRVIKLTIQYEGTAYVGWQRQKVGISVQGVLESALAELEGAEVNVVGAGRTDAGVHALGQVASVRLQCSIALPSLRRALNAILPKDIRVISAEKMSKTFNARSEARSKTYQYFVMTGSVISPFERRYVWHASQPLNVKSMTEAAILLKGRHDFSAFQTSGGSVKTTIRTITKIEVGEVTSAHFFSPIVSTVTRASGSSLLVFRICGDGFLRHMVRAIVGTLIDIGSGRREPQNIDEILMSGDRSQAGPTAPPQGLFLVGVDY